MNKKEMKALKRTVAGIYVREIQATKDYCGSIRTVERLLTGYGYKSADIEVAILELGI